MSYDSGPDTRIHIGEVRQQLARVIADLTQRAYEHDASKLEEPEKAIFDEYTPKLAAMTYGSEEYKEVLGEMTEKGLGHHYKHNSHHPEHWENGIFGMSLLDLIEMFCDWIAATKRHDDGDIIASIEKNQERFGYDDGLKQIFLNTAHELQ